MNNKNINVCCLRVNVNGFAMAMSGTFTTDC